MKRLKLQFVLFFILLATLFGGLALYAYGQIVREERSIWRAQAEKLYDQTQARLSSYLSREDARSFSEYRYYHVTETGLNLAPSLQVSSLASLPELKQRGLIGYFQIDPDQSFGTPYLPPVQKGKPLEDVSERQAKHALLEKITQPFRNFINRMDQTTQGRTIESISLAKEWKEESFGELGKPELEREEAPKIALEKEGTDLKTKDDYSVYPNPIKEKVRQKKQKQATAKPASRSRQVSSNVVQQEVFQKPLSVPVDQTNSNLLTGWQADSEDSIQDSEPINRGIAGAGDIKPNAESLSIFSDPFQAQLVEGKYLIFYRKVWVQKQLYWQGFVHQIGDFFTWLMEEPLANSDFADLGWAKLQLKGQPLAEFPLQNNHGASSNIILSRTLGYPLSKVDWVLQTTMLPPLAGRFYFNLLMIATGLLAATGLYFIYRSAATQIRLSQKRQDFVSAVTHELKTPLTSIRMYSEMLEEDWVSTDRKKHEYYQRINQESSRLSRLIDNVLQLARLEKKTYALNLRQKNPTEDFELISQELQSMVQANSFEWSCEISPDLPIISYDAEALQQLGIILVENAIKFSAQTAIKKIVMKVWQQDQQVLWSIRDHGPGIPKKELKRVFEKFYRVEDEQTRQTKGTGIGLAMAKMLVEAMGGRIEANLLEENGLEIRMAFPVCISYLQSVERES